MALIAAGACLASCATYQPAPLKDEAEADLRQPDLSSVAAEVASHPPAPLKPVVIDLSQPLTPEALGLIAVVTNPDLKAARAKAKVADAQVFDAGLLPDPSITLGADQLISGPDTTNAFTGQVAVELNALRERGVSLKIARRARDQVRYDLAWQEWQTAGQARLLAARIVGLGQALALDEQARDIARQTLAQTLEAASHGDVKADDIEARRIAAAEANDKALQAERDFGAARQDLNRLLGVRPDTVIRISAPAPAEGALDAEALFAKARASRLDLRALEAGYDSQEATTRKAVMDQFPSLQLTISRAQDTANNQTIGPQVNFTLPVWNRNAGGIAIARATREQLRAEYAARLFATRADIADLVEALKLARRQRSDMAAQVAPLKTIAAATEQAVARGDIARATGDTARQSVADKELALAALDQSIAEQTVALELAVGAPLTGDQSR
ncbi:TolC family protein [Phenylobacterium montanum]|uniref:TolC family protein n=1 Tax=Phenylobacterium montanum TaxID=2823693 RepID=A0A975G0S0_9CAUL|nr:TolC family protein [Caulobacter sp. S6]QUD88795.1 TolC family protein [Caulobacter sp. S6]